MALKIVAIIAIWVFAILTAVFSSIAVWRGKLKKPEKVFSQPVQPFLEDEKSSDSELIQAVGDDFNDIGEKITSVDHRMKALNEKLEKFISKRDLTDQQKEQIISESEKAQEPHSERLKRQYELGYALLHVDGTQWSYYLPQMMKEHVDWSSTEIIPVPKNPVGLTDKDTIGIRMPNFSRYPINELNAFIERKVGAKTTSYFGPIEAVCECLKTDEGYTVIVVGLTYNPQGPPN